MQSLDLVETMPQTEVYIIYKKEGDLMCYRIMEVEIRKKNALGHLDISLVVFINFFRMVFTPSWEDGWWVVSSAGA